MALSLALTPLALGVDGTWNNTAGGDYFSTGNWNGGTVASGVGATADFNSVDLNGDASITVDSPLTLGHIIFGDTNTATGGVWDFFTNVPETSVITLDDDAPTITVNQLIPSSEFDDAFIGNNLAGTSGFTKQGVGILTIGGDASALTGPINVNGGTLRIGTLGIYAGATAPIAMADGTVLENAIAGGVFDTVSVAAGGTGTIRMLGGGSNFLDNIQGGGGSTLNIESGTAGATVSADGDWVTGGGFSVVNMTGTDEAGVSFFRGRVNGGGWTAASFENSVVNMDNFEFFIRTNSFGNNLPFGALNGTATANLRGGNGGSGGSAARYIIGGLGGDSEFAGTVTGGGGSTTFGGMSINKIGAGTHTFSGTFVDPLVGSNTDIGRQGGVVRVSEGTLAFTNTADSIPGGYGTFKSTIDVLAGATLDVSGTTNTFSSSPLQQIQGSGTIVGAFNHDEGEIRPADVSTVDNDTDLTNEPVPTVGTITFDGQLSFNGGSIVYDMNDTPGVNDLVQVNGTTSVSGGGLVDPNFLGADPAPGLTYTFLTSSGGFSDSLSGWSVNWPGRGDKPTVFIDGNSLKFTSTEVGAGGAVVWSGAVNGDWDVETTQNWTLGGSPDVFFQGDDITFNDTGANPAINVTTVVNPRNVVVDSNTNNYGFSGSSILATGTLTKRGSSTLTLSAVNEFTSVTIEGGAVEIGANQAMGTGALTMSGATINAPTGSAISNSSLTVTAGTSNTIQAEGASGSGGTYGIPNLSGEGDLTINSGVEGKWLALNNTESFSGTLTIAPNGSALLLGEVRTAGAATTLPNAVLNLTGARLANRNGGTGEITTAIGELHGDASSVLDGFTGGSGTIPNVNWEIGGLGTDSDFAGVIEDGDGGGGSIAVSRLTKVGAGTLTLTGASTYTGDTTVSEGTLSVNQAFFADAADLFIGGSSILNLDHSSTDVIDSLYFGNDPQAVGTYGRIGNASATFQVSYITGNGLLSVTTLGEVLGLPGDYNQDNVVDAADYTIWRDSLGANVALPNDGGLGVPVGGAHYDLWRDNYGAVAAGPSGSSGAAPEPAALVAGLIMAGLAGGLRPRRRV
ncbi:beta strand repeat-containing protein [Posidoniimonas corsicana]|uniref:beta strand repeat-containing protein n=1 Tax=Posidoniimonas corsicana TaxID=1938618 RepID=UPI0018D28DB7|nr:autotransporter-associated beta strand repeat-containing protein [Posidoniimonas corsicana]